WMGASSLQTAVRGLEAPPSNAFQETFMRWPFGFVCVLFALGVGLLDPSSAQEKKERPKDPLEGKTGTAVGKVVDKGNNFIEVKSDGEDKARKYTVLYMVVDKKGVADPKVMKQIAEVKVGSRVEVEWLFRERFRATEIKVLRAPN